MAVEKCASCGKTRSGKTYSYYYGQETGKEVRQRGKRQVQVMTYQLNEKPVFICHRCSVQHGVWRPLIGLIGIVPFLTVTICGLIGFVDVVSGGNLTPPLFYLLLGGVITLMGVAVWGFARFARGTWRWHKLYEQMGGGHLPFSNRYAMEVMAMEIDPPPTGTVCFTTYDYMKLYAANRTRGATGQTGEEQEKEKDTRDPSAGSVTGAA
jgi:hypothetical protein